GAGDFGGAYFVILTKSAFDQKKLKDKLLGDKPKETAHNGKTFLESGKGFGSQDCLYVHSARVFIHATNPQLMKRVLDGYPRKKNDGVVAVALLRAKDGKTIAMGDDLKGQFPPDPVSRLTVVTLNGSRANLEETATYSSKAKAGEGKRL